MPALSLRARLLAGLTLVAVVLGIVAAAITATTRNHLVDQVDAQLIAASDPGRDGRFASFGDRPPPPSSSSADRIGDDPRVPSQEEDPPGVADGPDAPDAPDVPERLSSMYEAIVTGDGRVITLFEPNVPGQQYSPPDISTSTLEAGSIDPFTVDAVDGKSRYRVIVSGNDDASVVRALPLEDVDAALDRLVLFELVGLGTALLVLGAVAWWVIRLGIRPIKAMAEAADEISHSDLSARVPEPSAVGTEAGTLARTLNTMLGRIEAAAADQEDSEERLRRFVADASHELRTPVTTIQGYAELYRHGGLPPGEALDDAMQRTEHEAQRMGRLVEDMLSLAKLDRQDDRPATSVDLSRLLSETATDARVTADEHHISTSVDDGLTVHGDEDRLRQVVGNVVRNAVVHTPPGTSIQIAARRSDADVTVTVRDDGPGIASEHLDRITERFYRADPSRSRARGGSGLGLSIAEAAIEAHGGSLTIDSRPGEGTTVTLQLPVGP